ncbi:asparagine--tRNA ligase [Candidatus Marinimicrobia bacterium]|jgi:asparaginyl-tRNA synthetase|nr:asparagine--tRNA ligase [Candidatus Neomarinimicrobiota bacterium]MDC0384225.1 asparagine--tRNA ligase [Candidatus Neomarinimicrobiota bacterium]
MDKVTIENLSDYDGKEIELRGWVYNTRSIGKIWFIIFRDGTGLVQGVVVKGEASNEAFALKQKLNQEDSVIIIGTVKKEPRSVGGYELGIKDITIVNHVTEEYPISPKEHGADFLMSNRHLWLRSKRQNAIMRVRHQVVKAIRDFFDINGFTLIDSPIFTGNAVEGTTTLFEVDYFERSAYLTQSGQLYQEAGATAFGKTYCFGPTFRAEKSKTRRHLTEFWMVEPEMAYVDIDENMTWAENLVSYILDKVLAKCKNELNTLERDISKLENMKPPFPRITYDEAFKLLKERGSTFEYGNDFGAPDETILSNQFDKPIMIHRWPAEIKAFYMKRDSGNNDLALGVDMIAPEGYGEIIGGGQREDNIEVLTKRIRHHDLPLEPFQWYLDLRKYGSVPHSGFGMGLERTVAWICGTKHIRETIPFPRTMTRLEP